MDPTGEVPPADGRPGDNALRTVTSINSMASQLGTEENLEKPSPTSVSSSADKKDEKGQKQVPSSTAELETALEQLPEDERAILKEQLDSPTVPVTFFGLYRYADSLDYIVLAISAITSIAAGAALPLFTVGKISPVASFVLLILHIDPFRPIDKLFSRNLPRHDFL